MVDVTVPQLQTPNLGFAFDPSRSFLQAAQVKNALAQGQMNAFDPQDRQDQRAAGNAFAQAVPGLLNPDTQQSTLAGLGKTAPLAVPKAAQLLTQYSTFEKSKRDQLKQEIKDKHDAIAEVINPLKDVKDPTQRQQMFQASLPDLVAQGIKPQDLQRIDLSDQGIDQFAKSSQTIVQQMAEVDKAADRKFKTDTLAETVRKNTGDLGLRAKQIAQTAMLASPDYKSRVAGAEEKAKLEAQTSTTGASGDEVTQGYIDNLMSGEIPNLSSVPMVRRDAVSTGMAALTRADPAKLTPLAQQRLQNAASKLSSMVTDSSQYKLARDGLPFIEKIKSGLSNPGPIGDEEALDGLIKLANGGNAITEQQVKLITGSGSLTDWASVLVNRFRNGGSLSQNMRDQIKKVANETYDAYEKGVQPLYEDATAKLKARGIQKEFWPIMDVKSMSQKVRAALGDSEAPQGVDPKLWGHMTPEEQALWKK